jgi:hypothetical protein
LGGLEMLKSNAHRRGRSHGSIHFADKSLKANYFFTRKPDRSNAGRLMAFTRAAFFEFFGGARATQEAQRQAGSLRALCKAAIALK